MTNTNPIQDRVIDYLDAVEVALSEHGDAIVDGALLWARIDAASGLVSGLLGLTVVCGIAYALLRFFKWGKTERETSYGGKSRPFNDPDTQMSAIVVFGVGVPTVLLGGIAALFVVFNIWRWVGIFAPEMWIIHRAMNAVGA